MTNDEKKVVENEKETTYIPEEDVEAMIARGIEQYVSQNGGKITPDMVQAMINQTIKQIAENEKKAPQMNVGGMTMNPSQIAAATGIEIVEEKKTKELTWWQKGLIALGIGVAGGTAGYCIGKTVGNKDHHIDSDTNVFGGYMSE